MMGCPVFCFADKHGARYPGIPSPHYDESAAGHSLILAILAPAVLASPYGSFKFIDVRFHSEAGIVSKFVFKFSIIPFSVFN